MPESRKRKPKKKPGRPARPRLAGSPFLGPFEVVADPELARGLRSSCNVCGSSSITWHRLADAPADARLPSQRSDAVAHLVERGLDGESQFWACDVCDNSGAFGPMGSHGPGMEIGGTEDFLRLWE